jgi:hypothetical protein
VATENAPSHALQIFRATKSASFFPQHSLFEHKCPLGIVIQTRESRSFTLKEISALTTIANQISSIIINARLLDSIRKKEEERAFFEQELNKIKASPSGTPGKPQDEKKEAASHGSCRRFRDFPGERSHHQPFHQQSVHGKIGSDRKRKTVFLASRRPRSNLYLEKGSPNPSQRKTPPFSIPI